MALQDIFQAGLVQVGLLEHLLNAGFVFGAADAGGDGYDVLRSENFGGHTFVIDALGVPDSFLGQPAGGEKLHGKSLNKQVLAFDFPALSLKMRVDGGYAGGDAFVTGNKEYVGIVGGEWFDVVNRGKRTAEGPIFDQPGGHEIVSRAQNIGEREIIGWLIDCHTEGNSRFRSSRKLSPNGVTAHREVRPTFGREIYESAFETRLPGAAEEFG